MNKETINKAALVKKVQQKIEERDGYMTLEEVNDVLTILLDSITDTIREDKGVSLIGFGKFEIRERAARKGCNPRTGEEITIPATRSVGFSAGKELREAVPQNNPKKKNKKKK